MSAVILYIICDINHYRKQVFVYFLYIWRFVIHKYFRKFAYHFFLGHIIIM